MGGRGILPPIDLSCTYDTLPRAGLNPSGAMLNGMPYHTENQIEMISNEMKLNEVKIIPPFFVFCFHLDFNSPPPHHHQHRVAVPPPPLFF